MPARTIAVGDIHGCHVALQRLLDALQVTADDTIIVLGDVVDRGPGTKQVIEQLLELRESCTLIHLMGNHEDMLLDALGGGNSLEAWLHFGGHEVLNSYGGGINAIPPEHIDFLRAARGYWETDSDVFVHANLEPGVPFEQQTGDWLYWKKLTGEEPPHPSGRRVICGHTSQKSGRPWIFPGWVCIDTRVYDEGWLTALDVGTDTVYQASESAELRAPVPLAEFA